MERQRQPVAAPAVAASRPAASAIRVDHVDRDAEFPLFNGRLPAQRIALEFNGMVVNLPFAQRPGSQPKIVTMTDLGQHAGETLASVEDGVPAFVTKHGRFVAMIVPVDPVAFETSLLNFAAGSSSSLVNRRGIPRIIGVAGNESVPNESLLTVAEVAAELGLEDSS